MSETLHTTESAIEKYDDQGYLTEAWVESDEGKLEFNTASAEENTRKMSIVEQLQQNGVRDMDTAFDALQGAIELAESRINDSDSSDEEREDAKRQLADTKHVRRTIGDKGGDIDAARNLYNQLAIMYTGAAKEAQDRLSGDSETTNY